jgi:glycosyltransferase involved in cell wall biosynthesis
MSGAVGRRVESLASRWVRAGHDVAVVTGSPDGGVWRREWQDGVRVVRTTALPLVALASEVRAVDVVIAAAPPVAWALSGWALSTALRVPFVLELHGPCMGVRWLRHRADLLVSASDAIARALGIEAAVIADGVDVGRGTPAPRDTALRAELRIGDELMVACFSAHATDRLLAVARDLDGIRFVLVGEGAATRNVTFVPLPRPGRIDRLVAAADLVVVTARDPVADALEIMARARPVLLIGRCEAAAIVEAAGAGWVVARDDTDAIVDAIRDAEADPAGAWARGEVGRIHVTEHFDRERLAGAYLAELHRVTGR